MFTVNILYDPRWCNWCFRQTYISYCNCLFWYQSIWSCLSRIHNRTSATAPAHAPSTTILKSSSPNEMGSDILGPHLCMGCPIKSGRAYNVALTMRIFYLVDRSLDYQVVAIVSSIPQRYKKAWYLTAIGEYIGRTRWEDRKSEYFELEMDWKIIILSASSTS